MVVRMKVLQRRWEPVSIGLQEHLAEVLQSWEGTRYLAGGQGKQLGVDCVRFVCAVMDEILGRVTPIKALPQDVAFHQADKGRSAVREILRLYEPFEAVAPHKPLNPLDILVVGGGPEAGPGHAIIVGPRENTLWQSDCQTGVAWGGWALMQDYQVLHRVYRITNLEERWQQ